MSDVKLPPLPEPARHEIVDWTWEGEGVGPTEPFYSAGQMRAYGEACARAALQSAIDVCASDPVCIGVLLIPRIRALEIGK